MMSAIADLIVGAPVVLSAGHVAAGDDRAEHEEGGDEGERAKPLTL